MPSSCDPAGYFQIPGASLNGPRMIQTIFAVLFLFLVPGWVLVYALYPRKGELDREYDLLYRLGLGSVLSIAITVLLGFALNSLGTDPVTGKGYVTAEVMWPGIAFLTLAFFFIGWFRGAFPFMGRLHPALERPLPRDPRSLIDPLDSTGATASRFRALASKRDALRTELRTLDRRADATVAEPQAHYRQRRKTLEEQLREIDLQIRNLEESRAKELY